MVVNKKNKFSRKIIILIILLFICIGICYSRRIILPFIINWRCAYAIYLAKAGDSYLLRQLIKSDPKTVNYCEYYGRESILSIAIQYRHINIAEELLASGADANWIDYGYKLAPLHYAVQNNDEDAVLLLLKYHADINIMAHMRGYTPLHLAVINSHKYLNGEQNMITLLIEHAANVNSIDYSHETPLYLASMLQLTDLVQLLLSYHANIDSTDNFFGYTPLILSIQNENDEIMKILLINNANTNITDLEGNQAIYYSKDESIVNLLLLHGSKIYSHHNHNNTQIFAANSDVDLYIKNLINISKIIPVDIP